MSLPRPFFRRDRFYLPKARFLRPSLGRPSFISKDDPAFTACIVAPRDGLDCSVLSSDFSLTSVHDRRQALPLEVRAVEEVEGPPGGTAAHLFLKKRSFSFFEVRLAIVGPPPAPTGAGRRFQLFDLCHPRLDPGRHSLVYLFHAWDRFRFLFITDTHAADMWDWIQDGFQRVEVDEGPFDPARGPALGRLFSRKSFTDNYVNPNRNLVRFVGMANERAARGAIDFVILGGDIVDYQFQKAAPKRGAGYADTNFELFERIVTGRYEPGVELETPLLIVPGNHDYRLFSYKIHHYGLDRCGLHGLQTDFFRRRVAREGRKAFSFGDLKVILSKGGKAHPLDMYLTHINQETDFAWRVGATKFIFLDSGKDAFRNFFHVRPRRWKNLFRAVLSSWYFPNSEGLSEGQVRFLAREAGEEGLKNLVLVFHAGLINTHFRGRLGADDPGLERENPAESGRAHKSRLLIRVGDYLSGPDRFSQRIKLENDLVSSGLNYGGLFQNQLVLLKTAALADRSVLGLCGHSHRNLELRLDKTTGEIFGRSENREGVNGARFQDNSCFLTSSALAHVQARYPVVSWPEFYSIEVEGDDIKSIDAEMLKSPPLDGILFQARKTAETGSAATIAVLSELLRPESAGSAGGLRMLISFIILAAPPKDAPLGFPFEIQARGPNRIFATRQDRISEAEQLEFFGRQRPAYIFSCFCDYAPKIEFDFYRPGRPQGRARVVALADYLRDAGGGVESLRLAWHPISLTL